MNEKIRLSGVPETMLQTLYARAKESAGRCAIYDRKAEEIGILPCIMALLPERSCLIV